MHRRLLACLAAVACASHPEARPMPATTTAAAAAGPHTGLDLKGIDRSVKPGDDFFAFANGTWLKEAEIPADRSSWGVFSQLDELTNKRTADLIGEAAQSGAAVGSNTLKIGDYYASYLDEAAIEARGLAPLDGELKAIQAIDDKAALARALGERLRPDVDVLNSTQLHTPNLFGLWVAQDLDDPSKYAAFLLQGGIELPDRDYYVDASPRMEEIRKAYRAHIVKVLGLAKIDGAEERAARIYELELRIAQQHASRTDSEEVQKGNNHWSRKDLETRAPGLDWNGFLAAAGLGGQQEFVIWQPKALVGEARLVQLAPLATWKDWLAFHALEHASAVLPKAFVDESFDFYGHTLSGTPRLRERWKRAVSATNAALGEAVGELYVKRYFPASEKARAEAMVKNLIAAFEARIDKLAWMAPQTKAEAKAKLKALRVSIGYPDKFRDYSALQVVRGDAFGNLRRAEQFELQRNLAKLGKPVDRGEWVMNPHLVNAVNLPAMNALNFPAAILQPPFFDPQRPELMDYGAVGAVIGHEISHSFDNQGALFDSQGRLRNWWTADDFKHFQESGAQLAKQFDAYRPFPDLAVRGEQTLAENIADVAGLAAAYDAYRLLLKGQEAPVVDGFTGDQQFFLSFAQSWRWKAREALERQIIITDGHAPAEYRAQTVRNLDVWYPAFDVTEGQKLFLTPEQRVRVW